VQFSYLDKNILLRLIVLVIADIELFWYVFSGWSVFIARHNLPLQIGAMTIMTICAYLTVKSLRQFIHGFEGEMKIKKILSTLPKTYHIYYDLNLINRGNIDATVIGPTGIWTIEVKSHTGKITFENNYLHVNGYQQKNDFLAQAYAEAMTLKDYISARYGEEIQVHPVLVFSSYKAYMRF